MDSDLYGRIYSLLKDAGALDGNAPYPIEGVMIKEGKGRKEGKGTDHYTFDGVGVIPSSGRCDRKAT